MLVQPFRKAAQKLSFRHLLMIAFLMITLIMGATSIQALIALDKLSAKSREAARQAVMLTEQSQRVEVIPPDRLGSTTIRSPAC